MALKVFSIHTGLGAGLTLTVPKGPTNTQNSLKYVLVSATLDLGGSEMTIAGLQDTTIYIKGSGKLVPIDFSSEGCPSETDTDIVLTVPALTGASLAAIVLADVAQ